MSGMADRGALRQRVQGLGSPRPPPLECVRGARRVGPNRWRGQTGVSGSPPGPGTWGTPEEGAGHFLSPAPVRTALGAVCLPGHYFVDM